MNIDENALKRTARYSNPCTMQGTAKGGRDVDHLSLGEPLPGGTPRG
jgi:hypothetical protein